VRADTVLPLTVTVCTLNEESNIGQLLDIVLREHPAEVLVVDGGSTDRTVELAESRGVRVVRAGRVGLAHQRKLAVDHASQSAIALLDADHRPESGAIALLLEELGRSEFDGIEAQILSDANVGYFDWAMELNFRLTHNKPGSRRMIGTPCIYRTAVLRQVNFDPFFTGPADDTDLCYRLVANGFKLGVGTAVVRQVHRSSLVGFVKKWFWYGKGDAQFVWKHNERLFSILKHQLWNYPVVKSVLAIRAGHLRAVPFFVAAGAIRHFGMVRHLATMAIFGPADRRIYGT
jgi:glycosyltransferase involved in cell wall biosynthesis